MSKLDPRTCKLNFNRDRESVLENYDQQLTLLEDQDELRVKMTQLTQRMNQLRNDARIRELQVPREVSQTPVKDAAKNSARDLKDLLPMFAAFVGGSYVIAKLCLMVPNDFLVVVGLFAMFGGLLFGVFAYVPLWLPCKILDILTPFTMQPMMELLYGPVLGYIMYFLAGILTTTAIVFLIRGVRDFKKKQNYQKELKYFNENKDLHEKREKERVRAVMAEIEAFRPEYEKFRELFIAYDEAIRGGYAFLRLEGNNCHKDAVMTTREYIANMRADRPSEAVRIYREECQHNEELRRIQAAYEKMDLDNRINEVLIRMDEASLRLDAENARAVMERTAKKAHNAAVWEDYTYHQKLGDVDMDTYGFLKVLDLEI